MTEPLTQTLSDEQLDELRELLAKATAGPWFAAVGSGPKRRKQQHAVIGRANGRGQGADGALAVFASTDGRKADNAELAVALVNAAPALLAAVAAHRVAEQRVRAEVEAWQHHVSPDCWYTCPAATDAVEGETCCNDEAGTDCDCGLDQRRSAILAALDGKR